MCTPLKFLICGCICSRGGPSAAALDIRSAAMSCSMCHVSFPSRPRMECSSSPTWCPLNVHESCKMHVVGSPGEKTASSAKHGVPFYGNTILDERFTAKPLESLGGLHLIALAVCASELKSSTFPFSRGHPVVKMTHVHPTRRELSPDRPCELR